MADGAALIVGGKVSIWGDAEADCDQAESILVGTAVLLEDDELRVGDNVPVAVPMPTAMGYTVPVLPLVVVVVVVVGANHESRLVGAALLR